MSRQRWHYITSWRFNVTKFGKNCKTFENVFFVQIMVLFLRFSDEDLFFVFLAVPMTNPVPWIMSTTSSPLRSSVSMEVDLSVTPFRRWKKCHFNSNPNRRFSSAASSSGGHGTQRFQMPKNLPKIKDIFT